MRKSNTLTAWTFRIFAVLICLTLITIHLLSGMFARYSTAASGSDSARVARFNVSDILKDGAATVEGFNISMKYNESKEYKVEIKNDSEVAVTYTVVATNQTENLPLVIELNNASGSLPVGNNSATCTVNIRWATTDEKANAKDFIYHREIDYVTVTVRCEQVD